MHDQLIKTICQNCIETCKDQNTLSTQMVSFLLGKKVSPFLAESIKLPSQDEPFRLETLRLFFKACFLTSIKKLSKKALKKVWYEYAMLNNEDNLLFDAYLHLTAHLLEIKYTKPFDVQSQKNGRLSLSREGYWSLLKSPQIHLHAEFALLLIVMGKMMKEPKWTQLGCKGAQWQFKSLAKDYKPYRSFFSNYHFLNYQEIIICNAALFHIASLASNDTEMAYVSKIHLKYLIEQNPKDTQEIFLYWAFILRLTDHLYPQQLTPIEPKFESEIYCDQTPLIGKKDADEEIILTPSSCNSSMGALKYGKVEVIAFGPQVGELGNGQLFGSRVKDSAAKQFEIFRDKTKFCVTGKVSLPNCDEDNYLRKWQKFNGWLDVKLNYQKNIFNIQVQPIALLKPLFFVLYMKAEQCLIKNQKKFLDHSLEQYNGKSCNVAFMDRFRMVTLQSHNEDLEMKIIPLEGGKSFWGANYLIAYFLKNNYSVFDLKITSSFR